MSFQQKLTQLTKSLLLLSLIGTTTLVPGVAASVPTDDLFPGRAEDLKEATGFGFLQKLGLNYQ